MRIFVTMLGFNTPTMIREALINFEETTLTTEHTHMVKNLFLCGYPIPNAENNDHVTEQLARHYGWNSIKIPNKGGLENHNVAIHEHMRMGVGDYYVTFDPDVRMQQKGWVTAMRNALEQTEPETVYVAAARPYHDEDWCSKQHGRKIITLPSGLRVAKYQRLIAWSIGMFKGEWLAARPRDFKAKNEFYGYFEHADLELMQKHRKKWCTLVDYYDHHQSACPVYTEWKRQCADGSTTIKFEDWLQKPQV